MNLEPVKEKINSANQKEDGTKINWEKITHYTHAENATHFATIDNKYVVDGVEHIKTEQEKTGGYVFDRSTNQIRLCDPYLDVLNATFIPEKDDDKGYSICFLNTINGEKFFESVKTSLSVDEIKNYDCKRFNTQLLYSIALPKNRKKFISLCINKGFDVAYKKYVELKIPIRVYYACGRFGGKILRKLGLRK